MKLNFFKLLKDDKKSSSAKRIASEIVKLEESIPKYEERLAKAEQETLELRQALMGGGKAEKKDLDRAKSNCEEARDDLKALRSALETLKTRFTDAADSELKKLRADAEEAFGDVRYRYSEARAELVSAAAQLCVARNHVYGDGAEFFHTVRQLFDMNNDERDFLKDEINHLEAERTGPSYADQKTKAWNRLQSLKAETVETFSQGLLAGARAGTSDGDSEQD